MPKTSDKNKNDKDHKKDKKKHDPQSESESEEEMSDTELNKKLDKKAIQKIVQSIFPTNYSKKKDKKKYQEEEQDDEYDDYDADDDDSEPIKTKSNKMNKYNLVFTIDPTNRIKTRGKKYDYSEYDDEEDEDDLDEQYEEYLESLEEEDDDEWYTEDEDEEEDESDDDEESEETSDEGSEDKETKDKLKQEIDEKRASILSKEIENEKKHMEELEKLYEINKSKTLKKAIEVCKKELKEKTKKADKKLREVKRKNNMKFRKCVKNKNKLNDLAYFKKMDIDKQRYLLEEIKSINAMVEDEKPYRITLLESALPRHFKACAFKKINSLRHMEPGGGEYYKMKNWIDTFMRIPFDIYKNLPVSANDGVDKCHDFMENAKQTLDSAVYGLNDAKMQVMQMLGQLLTNPSSIGTSIAIHGPMGTGKTTMVKEGISKILGRDFAFIALGGATDSSFLEGHSYTYEGSTWGQIVNILVKSQSMNPVIYFDELDKVSDTPKGEEIIGILTHLTDVSQNTNFHDKYFSEIDFDLSKCMFIFSYNDINKVNPILRDRMYTIQTKGYDQKEKIIISRNHILPKIREQVKFNEEDITISDDVIKYIIENHTHGEEGMRNLKRAYEVIYTKLNLYRLMKPDTNLFEQDMSIKVTFPFDVTKDVVDKLIKKGEGSKNVSASMMYM